MHGAVCNVSQSFPADDVSPLVSRSLTYWLVYVGSSVCELAGRPHAGKPRRRRYLRRWLLRAHRAVMHRRQLETPRRAGTKDNVTTAGSKRLQLSHPVRYLHSHPPAFSHTHTNTGSSLTHHHYYDAGELGVPPRIQRNKTRWRRQASGSVALAAR